MEQEINKPLTLREEIVLNEICKDLFEQDFYPRAKEIDEKLIKLSKNKKDIANWFEAAILGIEMNTIFNTEIIPRAKKIMEKNEIGKTW